MPCRWPCKPERPERRTRKLYCVSLDILGVSLRLTVSTARSLEKWVQVYRTKIELKAVAYVLWLSKSANSR